MHLLCAYARVYVCMYVCMFVCRCVRVLTKIYEWDSENNQHNIWHLFRQTCGVQDGEHNHNNRREQTPQINM